MPATDDPLEALLADFGSERPPAGVRQALRASPIPETTDRLLDLLTPKVLITQPEHADQIFAVLQERPDARAHTRLLLRLIEIWAFYPELRRGIGHAFLKIGVPAALEAVAGSLDDVDPELSCMAVQAILRLGTHLAFDRFAPYLDAGHLERAGAARIGAEIAARMAQVRGLAADRRWPERALALLQDDRSWDYFARNPAHASMLRDLAAWVRQARDLPLVPTLLRVMDRVDGPQHPVFSVLQSLRDPHIAPRLKAWARQRGIQVSRYAQLKQILAHQ